MNQYDNKLIFSLTGNIIDDGFDLFLLGQTLTNLHKIFDKTYLYYTGSSRIHHQDRQNYKIIGSNIKKGSIIIDTELVLNSTQQLLFVASQIDPKLIIETSFTAFKFLLDILNSTKNNVPKTINIVDSPNPIIYNINGDNNTINVSPSINEIAKSYRPIMKELAQPFNNGERGSITICNSNIPDKISISDKNSILFKEKKIVSDVVLNIKGIVKSYSSENFSGNFYVSPGMPVPEGKYFFIIEKKHQDNDELFIESLKGNEIRVGAKIEYNLLPNFDSKIIKLHLSPLL